jgi:Holliday junction resolvase RusA-like endonuclease
MEHVQLSTPVYVICVQARPASSGKGKDAYYRAVKEAATEVIEKPIAVCDISVRVAYSTTVEPGQRLDADNVNKPTLDALKGVAYNDDAQVRSVTCTVIDRNNLGRLKGRADEMYHLLFSESEDVVLIALYSDSRLQELGGEEGAQRLRLLQWQRELELLEEDHDETTA